MTETLKTQLENLEAKLPTVATEHYILLYTSDLGPVAYLLEKCKPVGKKPKLRMDSVVRPVYEPRLTIGKRHRLVQEDFRERWRFRFRRPLNSVFFPATAKCPVGSRWIKLVDKMYDRLRAHDADAWELVLGDLLDVPSTRRPGGPRQAGRG